MHRMNAHIASIDGIPNSIGEDALQRIGTAVDKAASRRTSNHGQDPMVKTAARQLEVEPIIEVSTPNIKIASINDIPDGFERIGTGFYRNSHHLWELTSTSNGFELVRKHGEDHVLGNDPEPIKRKAEVVDCGGHAITTNSKVKFPHHGRVVTGTVIVIQPGSIGVGLGNGNRLDIPPDMCEVDEMASSMVEPDEEHHEPGKEFCPLMEPSSKAETGMLVEQAPGQMEQPKVASKHVKTSQCSLPSAQPQPPTTDLQTWCDYWYSVGQRVAAAPRKPLTPEQKEKRKLRRDQRKQERAGLPPQVKLPPKSKVSEVDQDDDQLQMKERLRLHEQFLGDIEYILQDESLRQNEDRLVEELNSAVDEYHDQAGQLDAGVEEEMEDDLSIDVPAEEEEVRSSMEPSTSIPKLSQRAIISMEDLGR